MHRLKMHHPIEKSCRSKLSEHSDQLVFLTASRNTRECENECKRKQNAKKWTRGKSEFLERRGFWLLFSGKKVTHKLSR